MKKRYNNLKKFKRDYKGLNPDSKAHFVNKTTAEIFAISNPQIGDTYFNTTEQKITVYAPLGWFLLESFKLYRYTYKIDFENGLGGFNFSSPYPDLSHWIRGNATSSTGSYCIYIAEGSNTVPEYSPSSSSSSAYIDILFPADITESAVQFDWRAEGEIGYDYGEVYIGGNGIYRKIGKSQYVDKNNWQTELIELGNEFAGQTMRIYFNWRNDYSTRNNPGFCIDNFQLNFNR